MTTQPRKAAILQNAGPEIDSTESSVDVLGPSAQRADLLMVDEVRQTSVIASDAFSKRSELL
jgi:hypothetical protein